MKSTIRITMIIPVTITMIILAYNYNDNPCYNYNDNPSLQLIYKWKDQRIMEEVKLQGRGHSGSVLNNFNCLEL